ncbi:MAG: hypothetical protein K2Y22_17595 [Candidatus Obscuribacterales bacterium]|nr:hypothetical protein [Candidatus Obscuribacterales bacterium]
MKRLAWFTLSTAMFVSVLSMPQVAQGQSVYVDLDGRTHYRSPYYRDNFRRRAYVNPYYRRDNGLHRGWYKHHNRWDREAYWDRRHRRWY